MSALHATTRTPVEMPRRLQRRPKDRRGYPIPYVVMIDKNGRPHFTINDGRRVEKCVHGKRCGLCGERLERKAFWFVGGERCFGLNGAFIDPPMHEECARYALQVCPFLAAPSYAKRIDDKLLDPSAKPDGILIANVDMPTAQPERFGLGRCEGYSLVDINGSPAMVARRDDLGCQWQRLEFWKNGAPA